MIKGSERMRIQQSMGCIILTFRALGNWPFRVGYWMLNSMFSKTSFVEKDNGKDYGKD